MLIGKTFQTTIVDTVSLLESGWTLLIHDTNGKKHCEHIRTQEILRQVSSILTL